MSNNNGSSYEQMQSLLKEIQLNRHPSQLIQKQNAEKLLNLSEQQNYLYGQATAHIHLARYYLILNDVDNYLFHLHRAKNFGERQTFYDILMDGHKLEGAYYISICDEVSAFGAYVEGIQSSMKLNDYKSTAIFYNNIAEIFFENKEYEEAKEHYLRALDLISLASDEGIEYYHLLILLNLTVLYCHIGDLEKACEYLNRCEDLGASQGPLAIIYQNIEIRLDILKNNVDGLSQRILSILDVIEDTAVSKVDILLYALESIILLKDKECAMYCLGILYQVDLDNMKTQLAIKKLCVECYETFGIGNESVYEEFFMGTLDLEEMTHLLNKESLKNMISLFQANKKQKEIMKKEKNLREVVDRDELTGLYNRRYYSKLISKYVSDVKTQSIAYMMIDVDCFKMYNDTYGHAMGDFILSFIASCLKQHLPLNASGARYGGDEFSCVFVNCTNLEIIDFINKVQKAMADKFKDDPVFKQPITLSFGFVNHDMKTSIDEEELIRRSDLALYEAKKEGRNTYEIYQN